MRKWINAIKVFLWALKHSKEADELLSGKSPKENNTHQDLSHLRLLSQLQQAGRLVDFLKEDLTPHSDADIGSVVRKIQQDCAKVLEESVAIRPLIDTEEGGLMTVPPGYDPTSISVQGHIRGTPPYTAKVIHRGWKVEKRSLPKRMSSKAAIDIIYPAQVEITPSK